MFDGDSAIYKPSRIYFGGVKYISSGDHFLILTGIKNPPNNYDRASVKIYHESNGANKLLQFEEYNNIF